MTQEKYNGNINCQASELDGLTDGCGKLADWKINDQYFCNPHKKQLCDVEQKCGTET